MCKSLVIVESPVKAKTISKYLGNQYIVKSSVGHVRDLISNKPKKKKSIKKSNLEFNEKKILVQQMGINPYKNWKAEYHILPGKEKIISELKDIANKVNYIYLATDLDREGEAIAWHLKEVIGGNSFKFRRVVFNEITKQSIENAFQNISKINMNRVYAQQARRFMDRIVGYMISPLLWKKISRGLSAGRVQSVAVRLIAEREYEIKNFIEDEYWKVSLSLLSRENKKIIMEITHYKNKKFLLNNQKEVNSVIKKIKNLSFFVTDRKDKILKKKPPAPLITSTLQQASNLDLGFSVKKTMFLAQKLYEQGYITYIRTDSCFLSDYAIKKVRLYIEDFYGSDYLPEKPNIYANQKYSQEAHEAIRPSDVQITNIDNHDIDAAKLYKLIWNYFVASQMKSEIYKSINTTVIADTFKLHSSAKIILFSSWTKILKKSKKINFEFPILNIGDLLLLDKILPNQIFTKPPPRFSESSLVRELEKRGIGRPSTYATIITKIKEKGYLKVKKNKFYATKIGEILITRLKKNFSDLVDYDFTARMEKNLDQVSEKLINWKHLLNSFFDSFSKQLEKAKKEPEEGGMELNITVPTEINCSVCNKKMGIKTAVTGVFLSCLGYSSQLNEKRCKNTINLIELNDFNKTKEEEKKEKSFNLKNKCKKCNMIMDAYLINENLKILICINNPTCSGYDLKKGQFKKNLNNLFKKIKCERCESDMLFKIGRFGKFFMCINNECKNTRKILPNGEISEPKLKPIPFPDILCTKSNTWYVLREGISGIFFAANTFPKSRETRSPFVEELAKFEYLLPEKLRYLASAPQRDNQGNKTIVCFNKLSKKQYVASKKEGKFTGWSAFFIDQKWCIFNK
ncbi:type I DNA topoisomerase [Buchnera aphidicola]|uniref:DNA topoisomerase 1 n=1 Tax=Buchnera aphidicola subsp. Rhopalosiphum maidis TaxID=118109 RepID=A0A3G2I6I8_BUCRM|nr:type I DNA topoisomerase [Buchnera aphidicola]AYN24781.1 type I DNA topoisomerase [Buchnera aphidicola (Rhopalosiphum maidis)]